MWQSRKGQRYVRKREKLKMKGRLYLSHYPPPEEKGWALQWWMGKGRG